MPSPLPLSRRERGVNEPSPPAPLPEGEGTKALTLALSQRKGTPYSNSVLPEIMRIFSGRMCRGNLLISKSSFKTAAGRGVG